MGCGSSKLPINSAILKEEVHTPLKKQASGFEEMLAAKNGAADPQFITLLCSPKNLVKTSFSLTEPMAEEPQDPEKNIETINAWELLAGLEDDDEGEDEEKKGSPKSINSSKQSSGTEDGASRRMKVEELKQEGEREKGLKRKVMAAELAARKIPALEMSRTGSLRDWLMQGGQVVPKFGSLEKKVASGSGGNHEENVFDPVLVAQLEKAMEELTMEEEEILNQIVEKWEGSARKVF